MLMKKVSKFVLRESMDVLLKKDEMKLLVGGGVYRCFCGADGNGPVFNVYAPTSDKALSYLLDYYCPYGGGCF
jgi:hypothetical protein